MTKPNVSRNPSEIDLEAMSQAQLEELSAKLEAAKRKARIAPIAELHATYVALTKKIKAAVDEIGIPIDVFVNYSLSEIADYLAGEAASTDVKPRGRRAPVKFRHPSDQDKVWSGRGSQPLWVREYIANGGSIDTLRIKNPKIPREDPSAADRTERKPQGQSRKRMA